MTILRYQVGCNVLLLLLFFVLILARTVNFVAVYIVIMHILVFLFSKVISFSRSFKLEYKLTKTYKNLAKNVKTVLQN